MIFHTIPGLFPLHLKSDIFWTITQFFSCQYLVRPQGQEYPMCQQVRVRQLLLKPVLLCHGMQLRMSRPYTSPQNGKVGHMLHTTNNIIRTLLFQASMPPQYWLESLYTATNLLSHLPTKNITTSCPYTALYNTLPTYKYLWIIGCACYPQPIYDSPT
jgi:hypothetical protein